MVAPPLQHPFHILSNTMRNNRCIPALIALLLISATVAGATPDYRYSCGRTSGGGTWWIMAMFENGRIVKCWGEDTSHVLYRAIPTFSGENTPDAEDMFIAAGDKPGMWFGSVSRTGGIPSSASGVDADHGEWRTGFVIERGQEFLESMPRREREDFASIWFSLRDVIVKDGNRKMKSGDGIVTLTIGGDSIGHRIVLKRFEPALQVSTDQRQLNFVTETNPKFEEMQMKVTYDTIPRTTATPAKQCP
ncbi:MAG: hypothetical protein JWQ98_1207 [Chlorobi bacterium]|nr:hypothetical protein [Chlorobiota bacterium]